MISSFSLPTAVSKLVSIRLAKRQRRNAFRVFICSLAFAIGVGLAYETEMGLTAGFRYLISATKAIDHEKNKNSVFQLTLGWIF